jgi:hypothetical protein
MAVRRGERGLSALIEEAVARFLEDEEEDDEQKCDALRARSVLGTLNEEDANDLEKSVQRLRER